MSKLNLKASVQQKEIIKKTKRQPAEWEPNKKKWTEYLSRYFFKEDIEMAKNAHEKMLTIT